MKIGELAAAASTPVETIRYYEREGLLCAPARTQGNFRLYRDEHRERLQFIRYCRGLDMSLGEVRALLAFKDAPQASCDAVDALLDEHIGHVSRRIRELRQLERQLKDLRSLCGSARSAQDCGILCGMVDAAQEQAAPGASARSHLRSVHSR